MTKKHPTLFITHRGERHQQDALGAAPEELNITMLRSPSKEEIIAALPGIEFLITERSGVIDADIIQTGKNLRLIQRLGSQTYDIDLKSAKKAGIPVCYLPVHSCIMVAEHMVLQILSLSKRLREVMDLTGSADDFGHPSKLCDEDYFAYNWTERENLLGLWESTVGILGFGEIGNELARRLQGYGCHILYNKRNRLPEEAEQELSISFATQGELLAKSDFLCMLLPYFPESSQTLDAEFFAKMKPGSCFVSCGGSGVVNDQALANALASGHLYGAAVDTFTYEPIAKDSPLLPLARKPQANLILTPHTAAGSASASSKSRKGDYINILRILNGGNLVGRLV
jgi:lactate dehydrogenase-like 2-hydroxyacid dehydrogenase